MNVLLYQVGRNLNRAYRTCASFGVEHMLLLNCAGTLENNLFSAAQTIVMERIEKWPYPPGLLVLETYYDRPLYSLHGWQWQDIGTIAIGGETGGIPRSVEAQYRATIPTLRVCLTVEAALAIALYEWRRNEHERL